MKPKPTDLYRAYLLRLWRGGLDEPWRVTLVDVEGEREMQFADLEKLCAYLRRQPPPDSAEPSEHR